MKKTRIRKESDRRHYEKNRERRLRQMAEYNRAYYEANRDRLKAKRCTGAQ